MKKRFSIRTKTPQAYLSGSIQLGHFPCDGYRWYIECRSYAGGADTPLLDLLHLKADSEEEIIDHLEGFADHHNLSLEFPKQK